MEYNTAHFKSAVQYSRYPFFVQPQHENSIHQLVQMNSIIHMTNECFEIHNAVFSFFVNLSVNKDNWRFRKCLCIFQLAKTTKLREEMVHKNVKLWSSSSHYSSAGSFLQIEYVLTFFNWKIKPLTEYNNQIRHTQMNIMIFFQLMVFSTRGHPRFWPLFQWFWLFFIDHFNTMRVTCILLLPRITTANCCGTLTPSITSRYTATNIWQKHLGLQISFRCNLL